MNPDLRDAIGKAAYDMWRGSMFIEWKNLEEQTKERWRLVAEQAIETYTKWYGKQGDNWVYTCENYHNSSEP